MQSPHTQSAAAVYQQIDMGTRVAEATPHRLIQLMMERALAKIGLAISHLRAGDVQEKGNNISDAISIINGLQASLNHKADKKMSENFDALYAYMMRRLLEANLHNDESRLQESADLLRQLKEAWDAISEDTDGG